MAKTTAFKAESGEWTPIVSDAITGGNIGSAIIRNATYTKKGNEVTIYFSILNLTNHASAVGTNVFYIQGLPYKARNTDVASWTVGSCLFNLVAFSTSPMPAIEENRQAMYFATYIQGANSGQLKVQDVSSGSTDIHGFLTYQTDE